VRYDTTLAFSSLSSWQRFDTSALHSSGLNFLCGSFDGRYVFMGPALSDSFVARWDSQGSFTDQGAWTLFDMGALSPSLGLFQGLAYDGRFTYFAPTGTVNGSANRAIVRYDGTKPFGTEASWQLVQGSFGPFTSAAYDGRWIYFAPNGGTTLARFAARKTTQPLNLPGNFGSTF
jgi:hypothetical protein